MEKIFFVLLIACLSLASGNDKSPVGFLLPGDIVPSHYDVMWSFEENCKETEMAFTFRRVFTGRTRITMMAVKPNVTTIQLNGLKLKIIKANLTVEGTEKRSIFCRRRFTHSSLLFQGTSVELKQPEVNEAKQKIIFQSPKVLPIFEPVVLDVVFKGHFYRNGIFLRIFKDGYRTFLKSDNNINGGFNAFPSPPPGSSFCNVFALLVLSGMFLRNCWEPIWNRRRQGGPSRDSTNRNTGHRSRLRSTFRRAYCILGITS